MAVSATSSPDFPFALIGVGWVDPVVQLNVCLFTRLHSLFRPRMLTRGGTL